MSGQPIESEIQISDLPIHRYLKSQIQSRTRAAGSLVLGFHFFEAFSFKYRRFKEIIKIYVYNGNVLFIIV
jgi:hypothetical protein